MLYEFLYRIAEWFLGQVGMVMVHFASILTPEQGQQLGDLRLALGNFLGA